MGIIFRQSLKGTIVTFLGAFIGFLTTFFVTTKYLTPQEIGLTRVLYEAGMLLAGFGMLGTQSSAIRYYPYFATSDGKDRGFFRYLLGVNLFGAVIVSLVYLLLRGPIVGYFSKESSIFADFYLLVLPMMFFLIYQTIMEVYASLRQRVSVPKLIREVILRLLLVGVYLLYGLGGIPRGGFVLLFVGAYAAAALMNTYYCIHLNPAGAYARPQSVERSVRRDFFSYTGLIMLAALGGNLVGRLDLFMVSSQMGFDYGGIYSVAFFMVAIIDIPSRSHISMSAPGASLAMRNGKMAEVQQIFKDVSHNQLAIGGVIFLLIWLNIDAVFEVIPHSQTYSQGKWVVFFLGVARLVEVSFSFGNAILRFSPFYRWTIALTFVVTVVTIVFNYYFISLRGMTGAAIATLSGVVVNYTASQILLWTTMKISPIDRDFAALSGLFALVLLLNECLPKVENVFANAILRTLLLVVPALAMLWRMNAMKGVKKELSQLWKKI